MASWRNSWAVVLPVVHCGVSISLLLIIRVLDVLIAALGTPEMAGMTFFFWVLWGIVNWPNLEIASALWPAALDPVYVALDIHPMVRGYFVCVVSGIVLWLAVGLVLEGCGRMLRILWRRPDRESGGWSFHS